MGKLVRKQIAHNIKLNYCFIAGELFLRAKGFVFKRKGLVNVAYINDFNHVKHVLINCFMLVLLKKIINI